MFQKIEEPINTEYAIVTSIPEGTGYILSDLFIINGQNGYVPKVGHFFTSAIGVVQIYDKVDSFFRIKGFGVDEFTKKTRQINQESFLDCKIIHLA
jgi:hypothetical protein